MPPPRTGSLEKGRRADGRRYFRVRIRLADGSRERVDVPVKYSTPAGGKTGEERAALYALAVQEREDETGELLANKKARQAEKAKQSDPRNGETVKLWSDRWLASRRLRGLRAVATDQARLTTHILPRIGSLPIAKVTRADLEQFVEHLDERVLSPLKPISWRTASHVWGAVSKMFADACGAKRRDLRVREDNPATGVHGPDRGVLKAKVYLWPTELLALVSCADVPLHWRRAFAITTYLYARAGEANALTWEDVDLDRRVIHIHRAADRDTGKLIPTKTSVARRVPIDPALLPLLEAMRAQANGQGRVLAIDETDRKVSRQLQRCLRIAKVKRSELFTNDATRKAITFHDLRATGITWCAVRGDDPLKIKQRAGHAGFGTTEGYIREAENLRDGFGDVFPALPESLFGPMIGPGDLLDAKKVNDISGGAGNRTQVRKRFARASTYVAGSLLCPRSRLSAGSPSASPLFIFASAPGDPAFGYPAWSRPSEGAGRPFRRTAFSAV
jgi:integrase